MNYEIIKSFKAKNIRLTVKHNGRVILTVPKKASLKLAKKFLTNKFGWIQKKIQYFLDNPIKQQARISKTKFLLYKQQAKTLVQKKVFEINKQYDFNIGNISVRNQSTRWGSCSKKGNLNFNFKILSLPEDLQNYLITHEICHLKEFNHSKKFWELVAQTIPDFKVKRHSLVNWSKTEILI